MKTLELIVDEENHHLRADIYLTQSLPELPSRSYIKRLIDSGLVTINNKEVNAHHKVCTGDKICIQVPDEERPGNIEPENIPLDIFYEDRQIVVVNKPSGLLVHPANDANTTGTLVNALLYHFDHLSDVNAKLRPGIVHRLDRETSGLILVAKDNVTHTKLAKQFERHKVRKQYVALVQGKVEFNEGVIDAAIGPDPRHHDKRKVSYDDSAKEAKTYYRVIKRLKNATLMHLYPKSGRTHQIRVHLAHLGHPVLGDDKYGRKNSFRRLALHAQSIGFEHPATGKYVEFSSTPPEEFLNHTE